MNFIIKISSSFILFTVLTKTYIIWAKLLNKSVGFITILVFIASILLIILMIKDFKIPIHKRWLIPLLSFIIIGPIIISILTLYINIQIMILQLFYILLFSLTFLYYDKYSKDLIFKVIIISLIFNIFAGLYSIIDPSFFLSYAKIISIEDMAIGRAYGFYLQPNSFAFAINLLFIAIIITSPKEKYIIYLYPIVFLIILLAGSRSNFVGFAIISLFIIPFLLKYYKLSIFKTLRILIPISIVFIVFSYNSIVDTLNDEKFKNLNTRINTMLLQDNKALEEDLKSGSLSERLHFQSIYYELIEQSPLVGYGIGIQQDLKKINKLDGSAHNVILEVILEGGLIYLLFFLFFIYSLIRNYYFYKKIYIKNNRFLLGYKIFILFILFYFFFTSTFFHERLLYILIGIFAGYTFRRKEIN